MKILVTGASGYIGFHVACALRRAGHRVLGLVRTDAKAHRLWSHEIEPVIGSMDAPDSYRSIAASAGAVVHAAVDYAGDTFGLDRRTVEVLQAAKPGKLIYTSGVWVYGTTGREAADETTTPRPPIRVVKRLESERLALESAVPAIVLRPGCVYGREGGMFGDWFGPIAGGKAPTIVGDGRNRWTLVNVDDLADGYLRAVESALAGEIINLTDRSRETVTDMVEAACQAGGFAGPPVYQPVVEAAESMGTFAECLALDQHVDSSKAVRTLGWQPRHGGFSDQALTYWQAWRAYQ